MTELNSTEYYARRERQERSLAGQAIDPAIAAIHRDMAERYARLTIAAGGEAGAAARAGSWMGTLTPPGG